jgi:hypothetical protein
LISGPRTESLLGDLAEQFGRRSRAWYWRQVLTAIAVSTLSDLRQHKLAASRALLVGWALYFLSAEGVIRAATATRYVAANICLWAGVSSPPAACPTGVDRTLAEVLPRLLATLSCMAIGWAVARLDRHRPAFVLFFAASLFLVEYGITTYMIVRYGTPSQASPTVILLLAIIALGRPGGVLLGGLRSLRRPSTRGAIPVVD